MHPELAAMIDGIECGDAEVTAHVQRCAYCWSELALYRTYQDGGDFAQEDLDWIVQRLAATQAVTAVRSFEVLAELERVTAALLLSILSPALLLICLVVAAKSQRWPLIRHERVGRGGTVIRMLKLRTMWPRPGNSDVPNPSDTYLKTCHDPRVTSRFAAFCRRFSIDELPQLLHVVAGEMSFVGPRPLTASELQRFYSEEAGVVLSVRPGMAGLWQTMGRSRLTYNQRKRLDVFYVRHASIRLYLYTLVRTVPKALSGQDAW